MRLHRNEGIMGEKRYIISDASKMIEVESHVLRYWEEELGIVIPRNEMGHRYYTDYYIDLFRKVKELKDGGFQLKAIKMLIPELMNMNTKGDEGVENLREELFNRLTDCDEHSFSNQMNKFTDKLDITDKTEKISVTGETSDKEVEEKVRETADVIADMSQESETEISQPPERISEEINNGIVTAGNDKTDNTSVDNNRNNGKIQQFQSIISEVVSNALRENTGTLGREVSEIVSDNVIKEMDYLMHIREKQEEERFKKLDETIRNCQLNRKESAKIKRGIFSKIRKVNQ